MKRCIAFFLCLVLCTALLPGSALAYLAAPRPENGWYFADSDPSKPEVEETLPMYQYYYFQNGEPATGWKKVGNSWYYLTEEGEMRGAMKTGWLEWGGKEYYLSSSGAMVTGWKKLDGDWYYFNSDGSRRYGWLYWNGSWYYLWNTGMLHDQLLSDLLNDDDTVYYANSAGRVSSKPYTGWYKTGGCWTYYKNGVPQTGWLKYGGRWYYLRAKDNEMIYDCCEEIGGKNYVFTNSGALSVGGWKFCTRTDPEAGWPADNHWYYANSDGTARTGWLYRGGAWYYLDPAASGAMVTGDVVIDGVSYSFADSGALIQ